jgi:hypothetical protein
MKEIAKSSFRRKVGDFTSKLLGINDLNFIGMASRIKHFSEGKCKNMLNLF